MAQGAAAHITVKFRRKFYVGKVPGPVFGMRALHISSSNWVPELTQSYTTPL
jgi:hypothetical protein